MTTALAEAGVELVLWNLEQTPYPLAAESADVVLLTEVLEHLRDYRRAGVEEARRVLRPGGVLLLTTPNAAAREAGPAPSRSQRLHTALRLDRRSALRPACTRVHGGRAARAGRARRPRAGPLEGRHFQITGGRQSAAARAAKRGIDGWDV